MYSVCGNFFHLEIAIVLNLLEIWCDLLVASLISPPLSPYWVAYHTMKLKFNKEFLLQY